MAFKPLRDMVLIGEIKKSTTTESGIIIEGTRGTGDSSPGLVVAVGPDVKEVKVGEKVYLVWNKGTPVTENGVQRVVIKEEDILAVLEEDSEE